MSGPKRRRNWMVLAGSVTLLALLAKPVLTIWRAWDQDAAEAPGVAPGMVDDVSRKNATRVDSIVPVAEEQEAAVDQLRGVLVHAAARKLPVSIAGASHSMGGHTIAPDGIQLNMLRFKSMMLDTSSMVLTVGSGALWSDVIPYLNQFGRAVKVMQSDNAFTVGGSISVNCHGWQHNSPPISSTVLGFDLMQADGSVVRCSRSENPELFSLVLGGYGLFGVILQVDLVTVPNEVFTYHRMVMSSKEYLANYARHVDNDSSVRMVYGRLNVNEKDFLERAMLHWFSFEVQAPNNAPLDEPGLEEIKRSIFLGSKNDDYGKRMRWNSEQVFTKTRIGSRITRNQVMNESPALYMNRSADRTDILHEYFIPRARFNAFIDSLRRIVPKHEQDLLNITIRNVYRDADTFLRYAEEECFAFVMFFDQAMTEEAEADMRQLTEEFINAALRLGGTYYLPYRLHATQEQLIKGYPMARDFFALKRSYDPEERFVNKFYLHYRE